MTAPLFRRIFQSYVAAGLQLRLRPKAGLKARRYRRSKTLYGNGGKIPNSEMQ